MSSIQRHRTALHRSDLSRPVRLALDEGIIRPGVRVLDYGCGRGSDVRRLRQLEVPCDGWDPSFFPRAERKPADVVNLGYVINVIEDATERANALRQAWSLTRGVLVVTARLITEIRDAPQQFHNDGYVSRLGTFQKYYDQSELREYIDDVLDEQAVAAAPGVFLVFRQDEDRESFLASRYRRRVTAPRQRRADAVFEQHRELFDSLIGFVVKRGRLPDESELATAAEIRERVGSLRRAFHIIRMVTGSEEWDRIRAERAEDLLIYFALSIFGTRPRFTQLRSDLRLDVRAFFSTYKRACIAADELLFSAGKPDAVDQACRSSPVGKLTPTALYVHRSALERLPAVLRVYEGCARNYLGAVDGANIVKLHRDQPQVSYLAYPEFDRDPHPALLASLSVSLQTFRVQYRRYDDSNNPPILHRKETFVGSDYPKRETFARLTRQEERFGLYQNPRGIGTRQAWEELLQSKGVRNAGHRLSKCPPRPWQTAADSAKGDGE